MQTSLRQEVKRYLCTGEHYLSRGSPDDSVDPGEYLDILREAVAGRNGCKRILRNCSPAPAQRRRELGAK